MEQFRTLMYLARMTDETPEAGSTALDRPRGGHALRDAHRKSGPRPAEVQERARSLASMYGLDRMESILTGKHRAVRREYAYLTDETTGERKRILIKETVQTPTARELGQVLETLLKYSGVPTVNLTGETADMADEKLRREFLRAIRDPSMRDWLIDNASAVRQMLTGSDVPVEVTHEGTEG